MKKSRLMIAMGWALLTALVAPAAFAQPQLCETAAATASRESGVPLDVLLAIALTETGRQTGGQLRPWPWAANTEGRGHWFASRDAANAFLHDTLSRGQRSIDLGCFQVNLHWHGRHFSSPEAMLDPLNSARYAARYLSELYDEFGTWERAAGAYHSRTPRLAARYRARFAQMRAHVTEPTRLASMLATQTSGTTNNGFQLFSGTASGASLFPAPSQNSRPLIVLTP